MRCVSRRAQFVAARRGLKELPSRGPAPPSAFLSSGRGGGGGAAASLVGAQRGKKGGSEEEGWPLKWKLGAGVATAVAVPAMARYAIENDRDTRDLAQAVAPSVVSALRQRKGGHFWNENPRILARDAHLERLYSHPVQVEVVCKDGSRVEVTLEAEAPLGALLNNAKCAIDDFHFRDTPQDGEHDGNSYEEGYSVDAGVGLGGEEGGLDEDIKMAAMRSWWDLARVDLEEEKRYQLGTAKEATAKKRVSNDGIKALREDLQRQIQALEWEMQHGSRSIDDIEADIDLLRKRDAALRKDQRQRRWRFLGM